MTRSGCRRSCWGWRDGAGRRWRRLHLSVGAGAGGRRVDFRGAGNDPHRAGQAAVADQPPDRSRPGRSRRRRRRRGLQPRHRQSGRGADLRADQCPSFRRTGQREPGGRQPADHQWHRADETFLLRAGYLAADAAGRGLRRRGAARELRPDQHGRAAPERGGRRQSLYIDDTGTQVVIDGGAAAIRPSATSSRSASCTGWTGCRPVWRRATGSIPCAPRRAICRAATAMA